MNVPQQEELKLNDSSKKNGWLTLQDTSLEFYLIIHHYLTYVNAFTLVHLSVFELASIYLTLVRFTLKKAQECQKIMCFNLC